MPPSTNKERAQHFLELVCAGRVDTAFADYVAFRFIHHNPFYKSDRESLKDGMSVAAKLFPERTISVRRIVEEGGMVAVHSVMVLKPGQPEMITAHFMLFENERIVELWDLGMPIPPDKVNELGMV